MPDSENDDLKQILSRLSKSASVGVVLASLTLAGQQQPPPQQQLLDRLQGHWVLKGRLGTKQVTHDVIGHWILNNEYLQLHEISREKGKTNSPAYEAIILFSWDNKAREYKCLWLDNTDGGGLSVPIARGKATERSIEVEFPPPYDSIHTSLKYDGRTDQWQMLIDDIKEGKQFRFGDVVLTRLSPRAPRK
ncbi:MAG: hypothetical protein JOZ43_00720 [Acidobacteriales bacterium]|nr:hypothetical protein [Terriglobales bacterium]